MRQLLWETMLDADMNARYWDHMIRRHVTREQRFRIALAILTSGTAASLLLPLGVDWVWKATSTVSAILSLYLSVTGASKPIERMMSIKKCWSDCLLKYEHIWAQRQTSGDSRELMQAFERVRETQGGGTADESHFPRVEALLRECQEAVRRSRRL